VKKISRIITVVALGAITCALATGPGATAAERKSADPTRPDYHYRPGGDRSPHTQAHADQHADYRVGGTDRSDRRAEEEARDARERSRWAPGAERYTRPPHQWHR
jgi:hypothetical protein